MRSVRSDFHLNQTILANFHQIILGFFLFTSSCDISTIGRKSSLSTTKAPRWHGPPIHPLAPEVVEPGKCALGRDICLSKTLQN